jgi:NAD(P)-dependent dehydrogenase (short-subunit alcohol dehydrogenase family)
MDIRGATFIVTGGASGLGAATARELAGAGAHVVVADLQDKGQAAAGVRFVKTDVTRETPRPPSRRHCGNSAACRGW